MYLFLLLFGVLLTVAGITLGISGVSIHERVFDTSIIASGMIAAAGGLILIGLGLSLRVLQRIELALAVRSVPRPVLPGEPAAAATEALSEALRIPLPPKAETRAQAAPAAELAATEPTEPAEAKGSQHRRVQFPTMAKLESVSVGEENEIAPSRAPPRFDQAMGELNIARAAKQRPGAASHRTSQRLELSPRSASLSERPKSPAFDALWPKGKRPLRAVQPVPAPAVEHPAADPEDSHETEFAGSATPASDEAPPPITILKSGVVDGMAYSLYSDGSIEAQLPQGTLRFGSITELRNHIEQSPPEAASS